MLSVERGRYVTASQAHRVMAGFEKELAGRYMTRPELPYLKDVIKSAKKPLVRDMVKEYPDVTGKGIDACWKYAQAVKPIFSEGMESVAREIAMASFGVYVDDVKTGDMERGNLQEGEAIASLAEITWINWESTGGEQVFFAKGPLGATPDGLEFDDSIPPKVIRCAEVKNPKGTTHFGYALTVTGQETLLKTVSKYYWQCQCGLYVTGAKEYHWLSHHNGFPAELQNIHVIVWPNPEHINLLISRADKVLARAEVIKEEIEQRFFTGEKK